MPKSKRNFSGYSPRKVETRDLRQRFLIVCEGAKTEPNYFRSFRVPGIVVDVQGVGENPSRLVSTAQALNQEDEYDQVWCVFDRDDWPVQDFNNAIQKAHALGFHVAYSNEAFELWYVLHFEFLNTGIPRSQYIAKLSGCLERKYRKNSDTIYEDLFDRQTIALKHAEKLLSQYEIVKPAHDNPSTTVHLLVKELNKFIR
jgi:hypothetical protein